MGKVSGGVNGPVSGKVGAAVFYTLNGENFVRSLPEKRSGKKTIKEKANTSGFAKVQSFMKPIKEYVGIGFKGYGSKTGGYKGAVSYALNNAIQGEYPDQFIDPEKVRVSGGELHFPASATMVLDEDNVLQFTWTPEEGENGNAYDQVFMLAYSPEENNLLSGKKAGQPTGAFRMAGKDSLQLNPDKKALSYHVYMGFVARDRSCQAHSLYMGKVSVPAR
ncbi:hypothetical protein ACVWYN_000532 [Pedobacter sp. UYP24]